MKALVLNSPNQFETIKDYPLPNLREGEILVRVKSCTICGTDIRILEGKKTKGVHYPSVPGHEIAGIIEETKATGITLKKGDRISVIPVIPCHTCHYCLTGQENICQNRRAIGYEYDGGFAEYLRIPEEAVKYGHVVPLPESISFEEGSLIEPLSCCLNGIKKSKVHLAGSCLIVGAGPIGLMHIQLAKAVGAAHIVVSEPNSIRRDLARYFGADIVLDPTTQNIEEVSRDVTDGIGFDSVILAIGVSSIVNDLLLLLRKGGTLNLFAGFPDKGTCTLDANLIHYNEITVNGTSAFTRFDYLQVKELVAQGKVRVKELISHHFALEQFREAYELAKKGEGIKIVIQP
jgi:L-iditol 2-dehydrogenase